MKLNRLLLFALPLLFIACNSDGGGGSNIKTENHDNIQIDSNLPPHPLGSSKRPESDRYPPQPPNI
ncbi:MAG TPA: hypothetical protein EYO61_03170 [Campylobacterales bacterium]|nr:hypothetical protein [Campylobacterales bacterium]HIO70309.1 hypothetical protein [Campylobacterales bacterium]